MKKEIKRERERLKSKLAALIKFLHLPWYEIWVVFVFSFLISLFIEISYKKM